MNYDEALLQAQRILAKRTPKPTTCNRKGCERKGTYRCNTCNTNDHCKYHSGPSTFIDPTQPQTNWMTHTCTNCQQKNNK